MFDNPKFAKLVESGAPTGEVTGVDRFLVTVRGLGEIAVGGLVYFENGHQGFVREVHPEDVLVLNLSAEFVPLGTLAVLESDELVTPVGDGLLGRIVNSLGQPIDGGPPITATESGVIFAPAHGIIERQILDQPLTTGVMIVDALFPVVLGQRIAVLGDSKTGKSAFLAQMTLAQAGFDRIVIHVLVAKRKVDVDRLILRLKSTGAMSYTIVVVASIFDPLPQSYLAPYVGVAIAEYFWHKGRDVIIVYDDLSNHAKAYRELSLLLKVSPGRDSYPGDMFYAHSSLLERAGRIASNGKTLSAIPVVLTPNNDITTHMPTSIISITDGQLIFDAESFRQGIRPAVNVGLSVSRVGGRAQTHREQKLTGALFRALASYRQAAELSHFGSELAIESRNQLELGKRIYEALKQPPDAIYALTEQVLILGTVMKTEGKITINVDALKRQAKDVAKEIKSEDDIDAAIDKLLAATTVQAPAAPAAGDSSTPAPPAGDNNAKPPAAPSGSAPAPAQASPASPAAAPAADQAKEPAAAEAKS